MNFILVLFLISVYSSFLSVCNGLLRITNPAEPSVDPGGAFHDDSLVVAFE